MHNLRAAGMEVVETVLTFEDFRHADEVFMTGNLNKVTPVRGISTARTTRKAP